MGIVPGVKPLPQMLKRVAVELAETSCDACYMLTMSPAYTAEVKHVTRVGSYQSFYIILEVIQVVVISELSIVASRSRVSINAFPTVARL